MTTAFVAGRAADLTWDNATTAGIQSTTGTWDNQIGSKWTSDAGATNVQWNNASLDNAIFTTTGSAYTVTLASVAANNVTITGGGAGRLTLTASTLTFGGTLNVESGNTATIASQLLGAGAVSTSGNLTLSNNANAFTGGVTVGQGSTLVYGGTYTGTAGNVTASAFGTGAITLENNATLSNTSASTVGNNIVIKGDVVFSSNTTVDYQGAVDLNGGVRTLTFTRVGTNPQTISGKISNGGLIIAGSTGSITLTNTESDFTGGVTLSAGASLTVNNATSGMAGTTGVKGQLGTGTLTINGGNFIAGANVTGIWNSIAVGGDFTFSLNNNVTASGVVNIGSADSSINVRSLYFNRGLTFSSEIKGTGDLTFVTSQNGTSSTYTTSVTMQGTASNTLTGLVTFAAGDGAPGSLTLNKSGGATAIAGDLLVTSGTVKYSSNNNQIADTSAVTVNGASAVFDLAANRTDTVGTVTLDGGGSITGTGTSALTSTGTFEMKSGSVTAILAGAGIALNKTTSGAVTLSGANTYTGATTVGAGTLALGASGSLASTSYSIVDGAIFDASAKTSYSLAGVATKIGVGATTSGFFNGPTGALTLGGALTLDFSTSLLADGQTYNLFDFGSKTGNFSSVNLTGSIVGSLLLTSTDTWTGSAGGYDFTFNQTTGGLQVFGTAVPEPSTYALLLGVAGLTVALAGRRR